MRHAGVEVIDAVSGRAVDDARAVAGRGVVGQVHRSRALIARIDLREWVVEFDQVEVFAHRGGEHLALQLPATQARLHQAFGA